MCHGGGCQTFKPAGSETRRNPTAAQPEINAPLAAAWALLVSVPEIRVPEFAAVAGLVGERSANCSCRSAHSGTCRNEQAQPRGDWKPAVVQGDIVFHANRQADLAFNKCFQVDRRKGRVDRGRDTAVASDKSADPDYYLSRAWLGSECLRNATPEDF